MTPGPLCAPLVLHPGRGTAASTGSGDGMWASLGRVFILSTPQGLFQQQTGLGNMTSLQSLLLRPYFSPKGSSCALPPLPTPAPLPLPLLPSPFLAPAQVEAGAGVLREVKLGIPSPSFRSPGEQERGLHSLGVCPCPGGGVSGERRCGWTLSSTYLFVVF